jgi:acetyl-CoA acyltransferase
MAIRELFARLPEGTAERVDDVILGNANGAGEDNRNVARMSSLLAGMPTSVPGVSVNRLCGSGAEAVVQASRAARSGDADLVVAGGVESMSRAPFVLAPIDSALPREATLHSTTVGWRMTNPAFPAPWVESLGRSVEIVAERHGITRAAQDDWAVRSHQRAAQARDDGLHDDYVFAVVGVESDESIRPGASRESLGRLPSAFSEGGTVTAGNASPINDGAVATLLASTAGLERLGATPLARIVGSAVVGVDPADWAIAPVGAVNKLLDRTGRRLEDVAVLELNEAFAGVVLSCLELLPIDPELVNPHGGAIAMGHPLGASAARVIVDCARELRRRGGGFGIATACIGVGQGIAVGIEVDA